MVIKNAIKAMEAMMKPKAIKRANMEVEKELAKMRRKAKKKG